MPLWKSLFWENLIYFSIIILEQLFKIFLSWQCEHSNKGLFLNEIILKTEFWMRIIL